MEDYINLAFDKLGYPHEDENPNDIKHITEYLEAEDTTKAESVLCAYPVLFKDPVVLQVITMVRQYQIIPPSELCPAHHQAPSASSASSASSDAQLASPASSMSPASTSPIFGVPTAPNSAASNLTDNKLFTILAAIADGSLTSMGYDFKTHTPVVLSPNIGERMQAVKLLLEINQSNVGPVGPQINILNNIPQTPASPVTPSSPAPSSQPPISTEVITDG